jgi:cyclophilin family peptidyl-prolyl cis-trans isomerase
VRVKNLTRRLVTTASIGATVAALTLLVQAPSAVGASQSSAPSTGSLVPATFSKGAGFTKVVSKPSTSTDTNVTGCPDGAQEEFANASGDLELLSEVLYCSSESDAQTLLKNFVSSSSKAGTKPPKGLGPTAVERVGSGSTYLIVWRRGTALELTGVATGQSSSSASTTTTQVAPVPLTAADQRLLANAATAQNADFHGFRVTAGSGASAADKKAQAAADAAAVAAGCPKSPATALKKAKWGSAPAMTIDPTKTYTATVKTDVGTFVITLDAKEAPQTVNNFVFLAQHGFFNCVIFHRVIPGFVDQTGDPTGTGSGGPGYTIADELPAKAANAADQYPLGSVAMANTGQPNSGGSQWFVVAGAEGEALTNTYSLFGQVTSGMSVVQKINAQGASSGTPTVIHRMLKVTVAS